MTVEKRLASHVTSVATVRFADGAGQTILAGRHEDQMHVVGHEAVGPNLNLVLRTPLPHEIEVLAVIVIAEERLLATIAPLRHMVT